MQPWSILLTLALATSTYAEQLIRSNALLSCMANSQFTASMFDVVYYRSNNSLSFEVSAISTLSGNFTADVTVIAYGFKVITQSVDLCDVSSELCPLNPGRFDVPLSAQTISSSVVDNLPGIAFTIPDLDGVVRVYVYAKDDTSHSNPVACVEATLSNGKTVSMKYVAWPIAAICFIGLLTAGILSLLGHISTSAHISSSVVSLFCYFQGVAIICMMGVKKLPPVAAAWGQNFMWTMGLVSVKFMQDIFNWYVQATGGTTTSILPNSQSMSISVQKIKRSLINSVDDWISSYYTPAGRPEIMSSSGYSINHALPRDVSYFMSHNSILPALARRANLTATSVTETTDEKLDDFSSTTLVLRGIQRVAYLANIEITSLFLTGFTFFLIFCVFAIILFGLAKIIVELLARARIVQSGTFDNFRNHWRTVMKGVLYRLCLLCFPQLTVICLWELTKHDSPGTTALAVITYFSVLALLAFGAFKTWSLARQSMRLYKNPAYILFSDPDALNRWGFLYIQFRATAHYFIVPLLIFLFLKCAFIAFAQNSGKAQAVSIFLIELAYLVIISWKKPYMDKPTNGFNIAIAAINFINALFFLFFSAIFGLPDYVAGVMGVVFFLLNAIFSLILLIMIIVSCLWALFSKNPETRYQPMTDDRESFIPNAGVEKNAGTELDALGASARDGFQPTSQEMYNNPETLRDDDASFYSTGRTLSKNESNSAFPNERLSRSDDRYDDHADLGMRQDYSSNSYHNDGGFPQSQPYTGYQPEANPYESRYGENPFESNSYGHN